MSIDDPAPTALLLDDHEIVLDGLTRALEREGIEVVAATQTVTEAVQAAKEHRPALCVVDLRLAGASGLDAIPLLLRAAPGTRVAVLTSFHDPVSAKRAVDAGAAGFLIKDASGAELARRLRAVAGGSLVIDDRVVGAVMQPASTSITDQERELLRLVAAGATNREIGAELHLSPHTIKEHLAKLMRRLGTHTRAETVAAALQEGLLRQT